MILTTLLHFTSQYCSSLVQRFWTHMWDVMISPCEILIPFFFEVVTLATYHHAKTLNKKHTLFASSSHLSIFSCGHNGKNVLYGHWWPYYKVVKHTCDTHINSHCESSVTYFRFHEPCIQLFDIVQRSFPKVGWKGSMVCLLQGPRNFIKYSGLISPSNESCNISLEISYKFSSNCV